LSADPAKPSIYPAGSLNANGFTLLNAVAFQITLGAPIVLFSKSLGASSTVIGLVASLTPLLTIFQLPAAQFLPRFGYKRFMRSGWGLRSIFIYILAAIPVMGFLDDASKIAVMLVTLFAFNLLRGIASCAWFPWITELIPEDVRGRFLSREQFFLQGGCLFALMTSAVVMQGHVDSWDFSMAFLVAAIAQSFSLFYLDRMPEVPPSATTERSSVSVPWREMVLYSPFLRLLIFNILFMAAIGGLGVFTIEYLQEIAKLSPSVIMLLSGVSFLAALVGLPFLMRFIDLVSGRILLAASLAMFAIAITGWFLISGGVIPSSIVIVAGLTFIAGFAGALFNVANARIIMSVMPVMGRNHFFALFTVITSLGLGASPITWGLLLDIIGSYEIAGDFFTWKRHSFYFAAIFAVNLIAFLGVWTLREGTEVRGDVRLLEARLRRFGRDWAR